MKSPKSRKAELPPNAMGGGKSHAEAAESAEFKMTELGPIPVDWEVKRLGEVCALCNGYAFKSSSYINNGKYTVITIANVQDGIFSIDAANAVTNLPRDIQRHQILEDGDILVSMTGNVGRTCRVSRKNCLLNQRVGKFDSIKIDRSFLYAVVQDKNFISAMVDKGQGGAQANISKHDIEEYLFPLPPLAEQRRIARALSDVDELISALGKLIEKKRNIKTGTMQQLLTGKTRLPGFGAKHTEFKQTELGPIPVDWEVKRFDMVFSMLRNNTYARESLTDEREGAFNIHYGDILVKYGALVDFEKDEVPCLKFGIEPNKDMLQDCDLIFADTAEDEMVGKAIEVTGVNGYRAVAGLHTVLCRPNASVFAPGYLGYYINSHAYHNQLLPLITGTKVSSVSRAGVASTYVCMPPFAEQKAIAAVLSDMDAEIAALEADRAKYERIKSGMMQELLTGRTRLKGD